MTIVKLTLSVLLSFVLVLAAGVEPLSAGPTQPTARDVRGVWSGTFQSRHSNTEPFTITVVINPDARGHLVGDSSLSSNCLQKVSLHVTVNGANVSLAGSDEDGANITFTGTVDKTGTLLNLKYILNGSASGKCESDDGTGTMGKR